jgi:predicted NAD/FAD-dependent oxidoreductase
MGGGALNRHRRRWLAAGAGGLAATLGGAGWWARPTREQASTLDRDLEHWLQELAAEGRAQWWDDAGSGPAAGHAWRDAQAAHRPAHFVPERLAKADVLVVGGGIAGLCAAHALARSGVDDVAVLDMHSEVGGNSRGMTLGPLALPCPMGAHYLPMPTPEAVEVAELLAGWGLIEHANGRLRPTPFGEQHLCHSPQERVHWQGQWHEGLMPLPEGAAGLALQDQAQRLWRWMATVQRQLRFAMPSTRAPWGAAHAELEAQSFARVLDGLGIQHPMLRAHLDYCCLDDYGASSHQVSAWAGVHYFASRRGLEATLDSMSPSRQPSASEERAVFTWTQGNAWLVQRLAESLQGRLYPGAAAWSVSTQKHHVEVDALHQAAGGQGSPQRVRWQARRVVLATPVFISARLLQGEPPLQAALAQAVPQMRWAPWLLTQLLLDGPLLDRGGAHPSWDNLIGLSEAGGAAPRLSLGYVDATHQSLSPVRGPTVLTHYQALGGHSAQALRAARQQLLHEPWPHWLRGVLREMSAPHPDLRQRLQSATLVRHGHAMSVPTPGLRSLSAFQALGQPGSRVHLAHADLAGYSVFEEACYWGVRAARWARSG